MSPGKSLVGLFAVLLLLSGCSGSSDDPAPAATSGGGGVSSTASPGGGSTADPDPTAGPDRSSEPAAPATTPVPPPTPGNVTSTVPSRTIPKRKAVSLKDKSTAADGVTVSLDGIKSIQSKARGPGEVAGPALRVTLRVRNGTAERLDLSGAVVNLTDADGDPGSSMTGPPADPLPAELAAGASATAVYVFDISRQQRNPITVEVDIAASMPTVVFKGKA